MAEGLEGYVYIICFYLSGLAFREWTYLEICFSTTYFDAIARTEPPLDEHAERLVDVDDAGAACDAKPRVADQGPLAQDVGPRAAVDVA